MEIMIVRDLKAIKLEECINELRDVLNELCCRSNETRGDNEKLIVSQCLDGLIVEYMKQTNAKH